MKISDFAADQKNQPTDIDPNQEDHDDREARVNGGVAGGVRNESGECDSDELPKNARRGAADECRAQPHVGVGNQFIKKRKGGAKEKKRHDVGCQ